MKKEKILFEELPLNAQRAILQILNHRDRISQNFVMGTTVNAIAAFFGATQKEKLVALPPLIAMVWVDKKMVKSLVTGDHQETYWREEKWLHSALFKAKNKKVNSLFAKYPFVVVDARGNLVGKEAAPRIGNLSIGRRRLPTQKKYEELWPKPSTLMKKRKARR